MDVPTPETLKFLQSVLEQTWESLRPEEKARTSKTQVAAHLLASVAAISRCRFSLSDVRFTPESDRESGITHKITLQKI